MTLCYYINGLGFISFFFSHLILSRNTLRSASFLRSRSTPSFLLPSLHCLSGGRSLTLPWEVDDAFSFLMTVGAFHYSLAQTEAPCSAFSPSSCRHGSHSVKNGAVKSQNLSEGHQKELSLWLPLLSYFSFVFSSSLSTFYFFFFKWIDAKSADNEEQIR